MKKSEEFIMRWERHQRYSYADVLQNDCYKTVAEAMGDQSLKEAAEALAKATDSDAAREKAHRDYLVALTRVIGDAPR